MDERMQRFEDTKARLYVEASPRYRARIDAFEAAVRAVECKTLADALRAVAGDTEYDLGKFEASMILRVADEIERWHC